MAREFSDSGDAARAALLAWFAKNGRHPPWRDRPPLSEPQNLQQRVWLTWLSEIMLQQTNVATASPYFQRFLMRWPGIQYLAAAPLEDVLAEWAGLGYYARARNLHKTAQIVAKSGFPASETELRKLPGIGPYTAAAIYAIGFGGAARPVDGNIERIAARIFRLTDPLPKARPALQRRARRLYPDQGAASGVFGDLAEALMDLGALICRPKAALCHLCPLKPACASVTSDVDPASLPRRERKNARPIRYGAVYFLSHPLSGEIRLIRRPPWGLLGGMPAPPMSELFPEAGSAEFWVRQAPAGGNWQMAPTGIRHVFTHFQLELSIFWLEAPPEFEQETGLWRAPDDNLASELPSLFRKALNLYRALNEARR